MQDELSDTAASTLFRTKHARILSRLSLPGRLPLVDPDVSRRQSETGLAFLAEASRLLAESLDYEQTLVTVTRLALPYLGAWCVVDLLETDGTIRRLAGIHPEQAMQEVGRELHRRYPPGEDDVIGVAKVNEREFALLREEVGDTVRQGEVPRADIDFTNSLALLMRFLEKAEEISRRRFTRPADRE